MCVNIIEPVVINSVDAKSKAEGYSLTFLTKQEDVYDAVGGKTYKYDHDAMKGIGGYCFGIHLEPDDGQSLVSSRIIDKMLLFGYEGNIE